MKTDQIKWTGALAIAALAVGGVSRGQYTARLVLDPQNGSAGFYEGWHQSLSNDGRLIVYSDDYTIHIHDVRTGGGRSIALDYQTGTPERGYHGSVSGDGGRLCFESLSDRLVAGDTNQVADIFVADLTQGTIERVSEGLLGVQSDSVSQLPLISRDGSVVVFESLATNLIPGITYPAGDNVFLREIETGIIEMLNVGPGDVTPTYATCAVPPACFLDPNCAAWGCAQLLRGVSVNSDGRFVAFTSRADNLSGGLDHPMSFDVFLRDRIAGMTTLISSGIGGTWALGDSHSPSISGDGNRVAFLSGANNLVVGVPNGGQNVYVWDRASGTVTLVSHGLGGVPANGVSRTPSISADGRVVAFESGATNLVSGVPPGPGLFDADLLTGVIRRISDPTTGISPGLPGGGQGPVALSLDGSKCAFNSHLQLVAGDKNQTWDVYFRDEAVPSTPLHDYCTAKKNSLNCWPAMIATGIPSFSHPRAFTVAAQSERSHQSGFLLWSTGPASVPFEGGYLCIAAPRVRTPIQSSGGASAANDCTGLFSFRFDVPYAACHGLAPGDTFNAQYWSRDSTAAQPQNISLSNALAITWAP